MQYAALTFHNFAKLDCYSEGMCVALDELLAEGGPEWSPLLISYVLWGFARLRYLPSEATRLAVQRALSR